MFNLKWFPFSPKPPRLIAVAVAAVPGVAGIHRNNWPLAQPHPCLAAAKAYFIHSGWC